MVDVLKKKGKNKYFSAPDSERADSFFTSIFEQEQRTSSLHKNNNNLVTGKVIDIYNGRVLFDIEGYKAQGYVSLQEFKNYPQPPQPSEVFDLYINSFETLDGTLELSHEKAVRYKEWCLFEQKYNNRETVTGTIDHVLKGGYIVKFNHLTGFLPQSQAEKKDISNPEDLLGKVQEFLIINLEVGSTLVISRTEVKKHYSEEVKKFLSELKVGDKLWGKVSNIVDYGIFITLIDGVDGLLYHKDIDEDANIPEEFKLNQLVLCEVIRYSRETSKISLGTRKKNAWLAVQEKYKVGDIIKGVVGQIMKCGAFIEIEKNIQGLVHISELVWNRTPAHPAEVISEKQTYNFMILDITERKISLGLKQCYDNPFTNFNITHKRGDIVNGVIKDVTEFGLLIYLSENVIGNLYQEDLTWGINSLDALETYRDKIGSALKVKILTINPQKEYVIVGMRQIEDTIIQEYLQNLEEDSVVTAYLFNVFYTSAEFYLLIGPYQFKIFSKVDINEDEESLILLQKGQEVLVRIVSIDRISLRVFVDLADKKEKEFNVKENSDASETIQKVV